MIKTGLLSALRKYRVRENSDPIENFVTEAFAWLLKTDSDFSDYFLNSLQSKQPKESATPTPARWSTQCNWNNKFPDMVCSTGESESEPDFVYVFEHKVWSHLHQNQLANYRAYADKNYEDRYKLILITAHRGQHDQDPDEALCWSDVYTRVSGYLKSNEAQAKPNNTSSITFIFSDFLNLLEEIGLAPLGAFNQGEVVCYSSDFRLRMNLFWKAVATALERSLISQLDPFSKAKILECQDFHVEKQPDELGRIGLSLFREKRPSIFVGVVLDVDDHRIQYSTNKGPDCSIILCFDETFHSQQNTPEYKMLTERLSEIFESNEDTENWQVYDHLNDESTDQKNRNHPFYIRKPFVELIPSEDSANDTLEVQAKRIATRLTTPLLKILTVESTSKIPKSTDFISYRNTREARSRIHLTNHLFLGRVMSHFYNTPFIYSNIWWDRDSHDSALCLKFQIPQAYLGLNLYRTPTGFEAWFFSDPARDKSTVYELLKSNNFSYCNSLDSNEHQIKAHTLLEISTDADSAVNAAAKFAEECLRGLEFTGFQ